MLSDAAVRRIKPDTRDFKVADGLGLFLFVTTKGAKSWRFKYRWQGAERLMTFGLYPEVSIAEARGRRDTARAQLRDGLDPTAEKKRRAAPLAPTVTFEAVAREWHALHTPKWKPHHAANILHELERDVFPHAGKASFAGLDAPAVLAALRKVEDRGAIKAARRARQRMSSVFTYGIASGQCTSDPAAIILGAMASKKPYEKRPAVTTLAAARKVLATVEGLAAYPATLLAHRFLALTAVRPGEVRGAAWSEFEALDTDEPLWRIPKERMKGKEGLQAEHLVPLSRQAVAVIEAVRDLHGDKPVPFPNTRWAQRPMSENALGYLLIRAGFQNVHCAHGWRSSFSTIMNEVAEREGRERDRAIIDLMLAHIPKADVEQRYNRAGYMPRRREIAQAWADMLMARVPTIATNIK